MELSLVCLRIFHPPIPISPLCGYFTPQDLRIPLSALSNPPPPSFCRYFLLSNVSPPHTPVARSCYTQCLIREKYGKHRNLKMQTLQVGFIPGMSIQIIFICLLNRARRTYLCPFSTFLKLLPNHLTIVTVPPPYSPSSPRPASLWTSSSSPAHWASSP